MGLREEKIIKFDCDLCRREIEDGCEHSIELNEYRTSIEKEKKYLCHDCLIAIVKSIGKEDIEYYLEE